MSEEKIPVVEVSDEPPVAGADCDPPRAPGEEPESPSRRAFFRKSGTVSMATLMGTAALMTNSDDARANTEWAEWFQTNYRLMSDEEKEEAVDRLERRYTAQYGRKVTVDSTPPMEGVLFGYALNIQKCSGCRRCVKACVIENNQSRPGEGSHEIEWIRVLELEKGTFSAERMSEGYPEDYGVQVGGNAYSQAGVTIEGDHYYDSETVPQADKFYFPVACMQCEKPPCVKVCPVRTTYREPDGIVVVDYNWCIGCRMCIAACPYWARRFNFGEPNVPADELNPNTHYLGNRPRMKGVVEKCTWCIQRTRKGRYPACVEACPVGARKFGNLLDPNSEVRRILARKRVFRMKADQNTYPKFFYFMD